MANGNKLIAGTAIDTTAGALTGYLASKSGREIREVLRTHAREMRGRARNFIPRKSPVRYS
jgi:gas vesicle protein